MAIKTQEIPEDSTIFVGVPIVSTFAGQPRDPTSDTVEFDFQLSPTVPNPTHNWASGVWEPNSTGRPPYNALFLVGPAGGLALGPGLYDIWVKITAIPETPVMMVGKLKVTNP